VADAGAGVRISFARAGPDRIAAALAAVLGDPAYRRAAEGVRASFDAAGGVGTAAGLIERLGQESRNGQQPLSSGTSRP
jgi:UDP:flavonoid glycosyltransferase YjiC (YdhE family)